VEHIVANPKLNEVIHLDGDLLYVAPLNKRP
jgi:hypothetical protein